MKSIKVHIDKLGLIRNADIEIKPLMLFSGYSGLGKSYVSILCNYFFYVWMNANRMDSFFKHILETEDISFDPNKKKKEAVTFNVSKADVEAWLANDSINYLKFMLDFPDLSADIKVELPSSSDSSVYSFQYEQEIVQVGDDTEIYNKLYVLGVTYRFKELGIKDASPCSLLFCYAMIKYIFGDYNNLSYSYVLPPARGMYVSEFPMVSKAKTGLYQTFINDMQELNMAQENPDKTSLNLIKLVHEVLAGDVKLEGEKYVYITQGERLPISAAAASVREVGSLQQLILKRDISKCVILLEEPESHLHPLKQIQMADIIALMVNGGAKMQITTHSDYFIRRLNDWIRLHILKQTDLQKYNELCDRYQLSDITLDPSIMSAYYLEQEVEGGDVKMKLQDITTGIPFDTFDKANEEPLDLSVTLNELTTLGNA